MSAEHARLDAVLAQLSKPTPAPLEGQETIDLDDAPNVPCQPATRPSPHPQRPRP